MAARKSIMVKLGLQPVRRLNRSICLDRVKTLRRKIEKNQLPTNMREYATYYANWYSWMAQNGGTRAAKK